MLPCKKEKKIFKKNAPFLNINIDYKPFFSDDFRDIHWYDLIILHM